jgi:hypothetical protein
MRLAGLLIVLGVAAQAAEPALSAAEKANIARQIAAMRGPADRHVAEGWTNAKKVAEYLCRPLALPELKKQEKGADRVFLGTNAPETLTLESNQRLVGTGTFRYPAGWIDFKFSCELNPARGRATAFTATPLPSAKP